MLTSHSCFQGSLGISYLLFTDDIVGWDSMIRGLNRAFKKLYDLKTFDKINYLKFNTWIAEANIISS